MRPFATKSRKVANPRTPCMYKSYTPFVGLAKDILLYSLLVVSIHHFGGQTLTIQKLFSAIPNKKKKKKERERERGMYFKHTHKVFKIFVASFNVGTTTETRGCKMSSMVRFGCNVTLRSFFLKFHFFKEFRTFLCSCLYVQMEFEEY